MYPPPSSFVKGPELGFCGTRSCFARMYGVCAARRTRASRTYVRHIITSSFRKVGNSTDLAALVSKRKHRRLPARHRRPMRYSLISHSRSTRGQPSERGCPRAFRQQGRERARTARARRRRPRLRGQSGFAKCHNSPGAEAHSAHITLRRLPPAPEAPGQDAPRTRPCFASGPSPAPLP